MEQGFDSGVVVAVNFGSKPIEPPPLDETGKPSGGPANRRAELWQNMKNALQGRFSIPDDDALHADLTPAVIGTTAAAGCSSRASRTCARGACLHRIPPTRWR